MDFRQSGAEPSPGHLLQRRQRSSVQIAPNKKAADVALQEFIAKYGTDQPHQVAELYALRKQPDDMFAWLQRAWTQHGLNLIGNLLADPFLLPYKHDSRFVALCKRAGLPVPEQMLPAAASSSTH